jgi:hypothetical protein
VNYVLSTLTTYCFGILTKYERIPNQIKVNFEYYYCFVPSTKYTMYSIYYLIFCEVLDRRYGRLKTLVLDSWLLMMQMIILSPNNPFWHTSIQVYRLIGKMPTNHEHASVFCTENCKKKLKHSGWL